MISSLIANARSSSREWKTPETKRRPRSNSKPTVPFEEDEEDQVLIDDEASRCFLKC
jgi:hypothetical protein